jgi:hypothetical protein
MERRGVGTPTDQQRDPGSSNTALSSDSGLRTIHFSLQLHPFPCRRRRGYSWHRREVRRESCYRHWLDVRADCDLAWSFRIRGATLPLLRFRCRQRPIRLRLEFVVAFNHTQARQRTAENQNADDSDVFILSGSEDLVQTLIEKAAEKGGPEVVPDRTVGDQVYRIRHYSTRIAALFARIERWTNALGYTQWRSIVKDNITTLNSFDASNASSKMLCQEEV